MYAGTKVNWHEVLMSESAAAATDESLPLFLCAFSADKGSEEITDLIYKDFTAMYGAEADFFKYGQPLIQAHKILAAGGRVLGKRLVAEDSTLANLIVTAEIITREVQKKDAQGRPIYRDADGNETTEVTDDPVMITEVSIKYAAQTATGATSFDQVVSAAEALKTNSIFPIIVVCDNGRGKSVKSVRFIPDYDVSKTLDFVLYSIQDIENTNTIESQRFAIYPDAISKVNGTLKNMALSKHTTVQFLTDYCKVSLNAYVNKLAELTGYSVEDLYGLDLLFAKTKKGEALSAFKIAEDSIDLKATYGFALQSGTNGNFGDAPFPGTVATPAWSTAAKNFFGGLFSDEIYDLDQHKIDFCVDANYPLEVKHAIAELAIAREDFFYFRDLGLNIHSLSDVETVVSELDWEKSPFVGDYLSSYSILDPFSKKQISVTMTHGLAPLLVNHYANNVAAPIAGEFNNFSISEAIEGTLNFIPRIVPKTTMHAGINQKEILDDLHVNYVNYSSNGILVVQSTYTSQNHWGPLSYSSNVIVTQMCVKDIRRYTPKIRFMLMNDSDFTKYKQLIENNVISNYKHHFKSIELIYTRDDEQIAAKIFNASLYCYYMDFPQGEIFDVFAVEGSPDTNPAY